ncbi:enoyl-CoA hydratase-related protein [Aestuariivirga sp.]|uniref:enoyl-CoA hydratase-related protein n=1 Tax=Aestuariivirga sp. TaxID=2650926 RepID=UPI00391B92DE
MKSFETIRCEATEGVARLTLARPHKNNALNAQMIRELTEAALLLAEDRGCRAVVLEGEGRSFCAGGDLAWMKEQFDASAEHRRGEAEALARMLRSLDELPQLVIAVVGGAALGGGVGLAAVCDVVIAAPLARFALTETRLGLVPATIAPFLLRRMGAAALRQAGLHGEMLGPVEAKAIGLVTEVVEEGGADEAVRRHVRQVMASAPGAVAEAKALFRALAQGKAGEEQAIAALVRRWQSEEARAGIAAFFAKEVPPWQR